MNYPYSGMLCLMLVGERNFLSSYLYPLPTQPDFGVYFFLSYLRSKTLYIFAHGFPLSKKSKASLVICQGFSRIRWLMAEIKGVLNQDKME